MLTMRLLGGFEIRPADGSPTGRLGPKPQALLAFLAMRRGKAVARGQLAGLLWGERDEELARHSLSQALCAIRTALGPNAARLVQAGADGLALPRNELELDVDRFERAVRSHGPAALQEACRLYRGEFLDGLDVREAGFEDWLLSERYRLNELAAHAFARLLEAQTKAGDAEAAVETARQLLGLTPLDEAVHARLIRLSGVQGRRGLAEAHYARCTELLRRELGQPPGDALQAALAEARRAATRTGASAYGPAAGAYGPAAGDQTLGVRSARHTNVEDRARRRWAWGAAVLVGIALLIGAVSWTRMTAGKWARRAPIRTIPGRCPPSPRSRCCRSPTSRTIRSRATSSTGSPPTSSPT